MHKNQFKFYLLVLLTISIYLYQIIYSELIALKQTLFKTNWLPPLKGKIRNQIYSTHNNPSKISLFSRFTYVRGSNMLDSMKHWVAMGGACWAAGWGAAGWGTGGAGTPVGVGPGGTVPGAMFKAFAATCGIWKPVPKT